MNEVKVEIKTQYIHEQSRPEEDQFVYAYTIRITNQGSKAAQLVSRYWHIADDNNNVREVEGEGVVGEQPTIEPGQSYTYTSGVVLETKSGIMSGHYAMTCPDGDSFQASIPSFALVPPNSLH